MLRQEGAGSGAVRVMRLDYVPCARAAEQLLLTEFLVNTTAGPETWHSDSLICDTHCGRAVLAQMQKMRPSIKSSLSLYSTCGSMCASHRFTANIELSSSSISFIRAFIARMRWSAWSLASVASARSCSSCLNSCSRRLRYWFLDWFCRNVAKS
jgi:hypothetical protein